MKDFFKFMASTNGRIARIAAGALFVIVGLFVGNAGIVQVLLVILGIVLVLVGAFDVCLFAPLAKLPFKGADLRNALGK